MNAHVAKLRDTIGDINRQLGRNRAQHLNNQIAKNSIRDGVGFYFSKTRSSLISHGVSEDTLGPIDSAFQDLLRCIQKRTLASKCRKILKILIEATNELEVTSLKFSSSSQAMNDLEDTKILETLMRINPVAASCFKQGMEDLRTQRDSWRGTAVEFRESLRELLDSLAPDTEVMKQQGFKMEPDVKGPTMKQKTIFILKSREKGSTSIKCATDTEAVIDGLLGQVVRSVYTRAATGVHTPITKEEAYKIKDYVTLVLSELLELQRVS